MKSHIFRNSVLAIASLLILYVICYSWVDVPVAQWMQQHMQNTLWFHLSGIIKKVFSPTNWFMLALLSLIIGCLIYYGKKRPNAAQSWLFFSAAYFFAFILGFILKFIFARYRPELYFQSGLYGFHFFKIKEAFNSTPSGHALANFAALYAIACIMHKRTITILLMLLASVIAFSRLIVLDHYVSDVIFGVYLGILSVYWMKYAFGLKKEHRYN